VSSGRTPDALYDAAGAARRLQVSRLRAFGPSPAGPALRRGFLVSVPVGIALLIELGLGTSSRGAIATGALFVGFTGLDAPARARAGWEAAVTLPVGLAAGLGVLSGAAAPSAIVAMAVVGAAAGYCFAVSLRFAIAGLSVALALLVAQGLGIPAAHAPEAVAFTCVGGAMQAGFSLLVWALGDRDEAEGASGWDWAETKRELAQNLTLSSVNARHAVRFGAAEGAAVATYWAIGMHEHGFWIPLTVLFVLRPGEDETFQRLVLRAVGTAVGLVLATALSFWLNDDGWALAVALTIATAFAYGLLTVQYALFTTAITTYAVLLADTLGEPAFNAAGQRGLATAIGILIAGISFAIWSNPGEGRGRPEDASEPAPSAPGAATR
jgi:hypothetical protein